LVAACDPDEVLLFGSHVKGLVSGDSDVDFLLIHSAVPSIALRNAAFDATLGGVLAVDVLLRQRDELLAEALDPYGFAGSTLRTSRSLYLRPGAQSVLAPGPESVYSFATEST